MKGIQIAEGSVIISLEEYEHLKEVKDKNLEEQRKEAVSKINRADEKIIELEEKQKKGLFLKETVLITHTKWLYRVIGSSFDPLLEDTIKEDATREWGEKAEELKSRSEQIERLKKSNKELSKQSEKNLDELLRVKTMSIFQLLKWRKS